MTTRGKELEAGALTGNAGRALAEAMTLLPRDDVSQMLRGELRAAFAICGRVVTLLGERTDTRTQGEMAADREADLQAARDGYNPNR